jgi:hypothetical protein
LVLILLILCAWLAFSRRTQKRPPSIAVVTLKEWPDDPNAFEPGRALTSRTSEYARTDWVVYIEANAPVMSASEYGRAPISMYDKAIAPTPSSIHYDTDTDTATTAPPSTRPE